MALRQGTRYSSAMETLSDSYGTRSAASGKRPRGPSVMVVRGVRAVIGGERQRTVAGGPLLPFDPFDARRTSRSRMRKEWRNSILPCRACQTQQERSDRV